MTEGVDRCHYCGAELDPRYYFCSVCATPYQPEGAVLPPVHRRVLTDGERIRMKAPAVARIFWTYFAVVIGTSIVVQVLLGDELPGAALFVFDAVMVITTAVLAAIYWRSLVSQLGRLGFDRWEGWIAVLAVGPLLLLNYGYHHVISELAGMEGTDFISQLRQDGVSEAALILSIAVLPAVTEEIAFRGLVQHWLHVAVAPRTAIVLAAGLFALMHFSIVSAPYLFLVGVLLGWARWRTGSLYPSMVAHFVHNFAVLETFGA